MVKGEGDYAAYDKWFDVTRAEIKSSLYQYSLMDTHTLQTMSDATFRGNGTAKLNYDFIKSKKPVFNYNDTVFVYRLDL
jgi:hypothetical protein